jgi:hypothetical protein
VMVSQEMSIHFFTEMGMLIITSWQASSYTKNQVSS